MDFNLLKEPCGPWLFFTRKKNWQQPLPDNFIEFRIDSRKARTIEGFNDEVSSAFQFPDYYGRNLNALRECLTDLDWLPECEGYLVVFENAESLLADEDIEALNGGLAAFQYAGSAWATEGGRDTWWDLRAIPFHTVFEFSEGSGIDWLQRIDRQEITICELELESDD